MTLEDASLCKVKFKVAITNAVAAIQLLATQIHGYQKVLQDAETKQFN